MPECEYSLARILVSQVDHPLAKDGTAIVVSHDRWFLDRICTHIIAFEGDSQAKMYLGHWSDYEAMMKEKFGKDLTPHRVKYRMLKR